MATNDMVADALSRAKASRNPTAVGHIGLTIRTVDGKDFRVSHLNSGNGFLVVKNAEGLTAHIANEHIISIVAS